MLEVEKRFDSGTCENFRQGEDFKPTTKLSEKVQYSHNQAIKNGVNQTILSL